MSPPSLHPLIAISDVETWLAQAKAGDILEYHRGFLAIDRVSTSARFVERDRRRLNAAADLAFSLVAEGRVHLVQRRHGAGDYSYIVVASARVVR